MFILNNIGTGILAKRSSIVMELNKETKQFISNINFLSNDKAKTIRLIENEFSKKQSESNFFLDLYYFRCTWT